MSNKYLSELEEALLSGFKSMGLNRSPLMKLPSELREQIIFESYKTSETSSTNNPAVNISGIPSVAINPHGDPWVLRGTPLRKTDKCRLMFVNKQLHCEAEQILYSKFTFRFNSGLSAESVNMFLKKLSRDARSFISHIEILSCIPLSQTSVVRGPGLPGHQFQLPIPSNDGLKMLKNLGPSGVITPFQLWLPKLKSLKLILESSSQDRNLSQVFLLRFMLDAAYVCNLYHPANFLYHGGIRVSIHIKCPRGIAFAPCGPGSEANLLADIVWEENN